jgi:hypothetical protein
MSELDEKTYSVNEVDALEAEVFKKAIRECIRRVEQATDVKVKQGWLDRGCCLDTAKEVVLEVREAILSSLRAYLEEE